MLDYIKPLSLQCLLRLWQHKQGKLTDGTCSVQFKQESVIRVIEAICHQRLVCKSQQAPGTWE